MNRSEIGWLLFIGLYPVLIAIEHLVGIHFRTGTVHAVLSVDLQLFGHLMTYEIPLIVSPAVC